jgi:hypothetical protein
MTLLWVKFGRLATVVLVPIEPAVGADCYDKTLGAQHLGVAGAPTFVSITSGNDDSLSNFYNWGRFVIANCDDSSAARGITIGNYDADLTHSLSYLHLDTISASDSVMAFPPANSTDNWFDSLGPKTIAYKMRDLHCPYKDEPIVTCYVTDADMYKMNFEPKGDIRHAGPVWNIATDRSTIDLTNEPDMLNARHNGDDEAVWARW